MSASHTIAQRAAEEPGTGPELSVIVLTYQGERWITGQLRSILDQLGHGEPVAEVIISDDGSRDATCEIAERLLSGSGVPFRIVTRDAPLGVAGNAWAAVQQCRGTFIAFADQDDAWLPGKLSRLLSVLRDDPRVLLVHSDARLVDERGAVLEPSLLASLEISPREWDEYGGHEGGRQLAALARRNLVTGATMIVRRELALRAGPAPEPWIHDEWLAITAALSDGIRTVREPLVDYRQHGGNQIGQRTLSFGGKVRKALAPGAADQLRKARRATALLRRCRQLGASEAQEALLRAKAVHERRRAVLPAARLARAPRVLRWWLRGEYGRYSRGTQDALRDLLQSHADRDGKRAGAS